MHVAILDLTTPFADTKPADTAGFLLRAWLSPHLPEATFDIIPVATGAALPEAGDYDAFVISGSEKGVYDVTAWMAPLRALLLAAKRSRKPLVGICFGHQIMADTFGGRAEKVPLGMVVGVREFEIGDACLPAHVWHQDQVTVVPPDARVSGASPYCPAAVLEYDFPAFSVQFHPEFTRDYLTREIGAARGRILGDEQADSALREIAEGAVSPDLMARHAAETLRRITA